MPRTIAVANQKGGVGKTSTTLGLAAAVAHAGRRVLVVDMDPQSNASMTLLPDYASRVADESLFTTHDLMEPDVDPADVGEAIVSTSWAGVDLIASSEALAAREVEGSVAIEMRLRKVLRGLPTTYDVVLIDCPPSLGRLTTNSLLASSEVVLVAEADSYSKNALERTRATLQVVRSDYEHQVTTLGLIVNKVEAATTEGSSRLVEMQEMFGDDLLGVIPKRVVIRQAAGQHKSVFDVARPEAREVAEQYTALAKRLGLVGGARSGSKGRR